MLYLSKTKTITKAEGIENSFESKYAQLEYLGNDEFELSYIRHTGQWW